MRFEEALSDTFEVSDTYLQQGSIHMQEQFAPYISENIALN